MLLNQYTFYRKYGVRMVGQLPAPMMHDLKFLEFPRETVYHFLDFDAISDGPANDDALLRNVKKVIPILTPLHLTKLDGHPHRLGGDGTPLLREYLKSHRRMRRAVNIQQAMKDKDTPVVVNYALLPKMYKYQPTAFAAYYSWRNLFGTFLDEFAKLAPESPTHQHYVFVHVPKTLPSVRQLQDAVMHLTPTTLRVFREPASFMLLELWKWFNPNPEHPSIFEAVPKKNAHQLNFIYLEAGKWCVVNFGTLNSFYLPEGQKEADPEYVLTSRQHVTGVQLGRRLLRMYMSVMEARNAALKQLLAQERQDAAQLDRESAIQQQSQTDENTNHPVVVSATSGAAEKSQAAHPAVELEQEKLAAEMSSLLANISIVDEEEFANLSHDEFHQLIREQDMEIDQDLQQLEIISEKMLQEATHETAEEIIKADVNHAPEQGVVEVCDRLAISGSISAAEYRKYQKAAQAYKDIKAPFGEGSLESFLKIEPQSLKIESQVQMPDANTVIDKSMLKSSLSLFDSKYVKEVLHRDIANTVMSVQKAGVAVSGYKVERIEDILGGYEEHVVRLTPVVGQPSTVRFKIPIVREDGSYVTNGVKYRLRKQRGDVPIRKTAPNVVALTSYYGKCFITRGKRNSDSYGYWLQTTALAAALDKTNAHLSDPVCDNAFDNTLHAPRAYSAISNTLVAVTVQGRYRVRFDHAKAVKEENIEGHPRTAPLYLGEDTQGEGRLWLDINGHVWQQQNDGQMHAFGTLEQFLMIGNDNAPIEYTTARIFGKDIPVGVVLGLGMGMERLLGALRLTPRVVAAGEKVNLETGEWALRFSDETWVFDRKDVFASLVIGGFKEYEKSLRMFSAHSFDKRGAYVNLLETNGIGVRFVREIDLMTNMFVDSITRDILLEMKEPTTFKGLLLRANQMLLTDEHPDELDPAFMRIKGYERISGAIYAELIGSLRQHNSSLGDPALACR
jgi:hypothetical protein